MSDCDEMNPIWPRKYDFFGASVVFLEHIDNTIVVVGHGSARNASQVIGSRTGEWVKSGKPG